MPVKIPDGLPAIEALAKENIFVMTQQRAIRQDIRPLRIAILNLMPTKQTTETQLLRMLGNTPLQVEVTLLHTGSYTSRNTGRDYLDAFYRTFDEVRGERFDGLVVTGAPVEQYRFEDVYYWDELVGLMDWADRNVFSTLYICWAAQAALYHFYGIDKKPLDDKLFGIFEHRILGRGHRLLRGFDDVFYAPHSRHTTIHAADAEKERDLDILAVSDEAGLYLAASRDGGRIFVTGHSEYDADTLELEYRRDQLAGKPIRRPVHYYPNDDEGLRPPLAWRAHGSLLFANWLNYFVYQETPYDVSAIPGSKKR
ncbi:MAG: homoserine O-succinyltransferase [Clostridia bacterium]|nr:homoserine O-succinyltransferase [Clostridia bacterium]